MSAAMALHVALSLRLDAIEAYRLANNYRAEVLRNEASNLRRVEREAVPEGALGTKTGLLKAALILDERADLIGEKPAAPSGSDAPDFFRPDHTYQRRRWLFQCLAVAPNPFNGETRAVGFLYRLGEPATATALDPDDWAHGGWTDVIEGGAR